MNSLILVTGSRDWPDEEKAKRILRHYIHDATVVMHGGAGGRGHHPRASEGLFWSSKSWGVDYWAGVVALELGVRQEVVPYKGEFGKRGGMVRNEEMVQRCVKAKELGWNVLVLALCHNESKGTTHCWNAAKKAGLNACMYTTALPLPEFIR